MKQLACAGQGLARRRDDPLLCVVSISYQQNVDCGKNSLYEGRLRIFGCISKLCITSIKGLTTKLIIDRQSR